MTSMIEFSGRVLLEFLLCSRVFPFLQMVGRGVSVGHTLTSDAFLFFFRSIKPALGGSVQE
jgi:hypothetical protein